MLCVRHTHSRETLFDSILPMIRSQSEDMHQSLQTCAHHLPASFSAFCCQLVLHVVSQEQPVGTATLTSPHTCVCAHWHEQCTVVCAHWHEQCTVCVDTGMNSALWCAHWHEQCTVMCGHWHEQCTVVCTLA